MARLASYDHLLVLLFMVVFVVIVKLIVKYSLFLYAVVVIAAYPLLVGPGSAACRAPSGIESIWHHSTFCCGQFTHCCCVVVVSHELVVILLKCVKLRVDDNLLRNTKLTTARCR